MGILGKLKKVGGNIVHTVEKAGKDSFNEVKRHPGTYATIAAGLATGGVGAIASGGVKAGLKTVGKKVLVDGVKNTIMPKKADGSVDIGKTARNLVGVGTAIEGYQKDRKADKLQNEALDYARKEYDANAPLRESSRKAIMEGPKKQDLSGLFDAQNGNPYRKRRLAAVGARAGGY